MLLNLGEVFLVTLLGFMPLIIVHWADLHPKPRMPRWVRAALHTCAVIKTSVLVSMTDWLIAVVF